MRKEKHVDELGEGEPINCRRVSYIQFLRMNGALHLELESHVSVLLEYHGRFPSAIDAHERMSQDSQLGRQVVHAWRCM